MTALTIILAVLSVIGHGLAIFWPRKPLKERLDANGFPILWCNNDEKQKNVACVWDDAVEHPVNVAHDELAQRRSA
jgi:hypothetical protein